MLAANQNYPIILGHAVNVGCGPSLARTVKPEFDKGVERDREEDSQCLIHVVNIGYCARHA